ncbi:hypothetical protein [Escherichia coli ISC7]|uniref:Uncharacterized protein n=1 Tax=Escherichia coli ISC7 TaxID=1432555 RepID=W1EYW7_ECOLX|nr:hypothetical protein [Escherichia coli ISC7]
MLGFQLEILLHHGRMGVEIFLLHSWGYVRFPDIKWGVMVFIFVVIT